jgi:hypothetical protein
VIALCWFRLWTLVFVIFFILVSIFDISSLFWAVCFFSSAVCALIAAIFAYIADYPYFYTIEVVFTFTAAPADEAKWPVELPAALSLTFGVPVGAYTLLFTAVLFALDDVLPDFF